MKQITIIITLLSFLVCNTIYSQSKIYFDEDWEISTKEKAFFYRTITTKNDSLFHVKDYYIKGVLQMEGHYSNLENEIMEGEVNFYNEQGKITNSKTFSKGELNGLSTTYLKNGEIDYRTEYKKGEIYNGVYKGAVLKRFYKNGEVTKDIEHSPPNKYYILKTTIYGKDRDSIYWRTTKGKQLGFGIYKDHEIIDGLNVLNLLDNTVYTYYKNGLKEGVQKVFDSKGELINNRTFKNNELIQDESLNPLTNKMVTCTFKDNRRFEGRSFEYKPMYKYYDEYIFKNGIKTTHNRYSISEDGKLELSN